MSERTDRDSYEAGRGSHEDAGGSRRRKPMEMPTFGSAMRVRIVLNHLGDVKLPREVTLNQAFWAALVALIVFFATGLFMGGIYRAAPVIAALILTPGLVAPLEETGRSVPRTIGRMVSFYLSPRLFFGVVPLRSTPAKRRRIERMIAQGGGARGAKSASATREILSALGAILSDLWTAYAGAMKRGGKRA